MGVMDPMSAVKTAEKFSKIRWDFPYRFVASVGAISTGFCWFRRDAETPLDLLARAARWAGLDITRHTNRVSEWLTAPNRLSIIGSTARLVLLVSLVATLAWAYQHTSPGTTRSTATLLLAETVLTQLNGPPDLLNWSNIIWFWIPLAVSLVWSAMGRQKWLAAVGLATFDLALSAVYAVLVPLLWCTTLDARATTPS